MKVVVELHNGGAGVDNEILSRLVQLCVEGKLELNGDLYIQGRQYGVYSNVGMTVVYTEEFDHETEVVSARLQD